MPAAGPSRSIREIPSMPGIADSIFSPQMSSFDFDQPSAELDSCFEPETECLSPVQGTFALPQTTTSMFADQTAHSMTAWSVEAEESHHGQEVSWSQPTRQSLDVQTKMDHTAAVLAPLSQVVAMPRSSAITVEMIHALAHRPLKKAATALGISGTVLKRVCRDLGFKKWPRQMVDTTITYSSMKGVGYNTSGRDATKNQDLYSFEFNPDSQSFARSNSGSYSKCSTSSANTCRPPTPATVDFSQPFRVPEIDHQPAHVPYSSFSEDVLTSDSVFPTGATVFPYENKSLPLDDELEMLDRGLFPTSANSKTEPEEDEVDVGQQCLLSASLWVVDTRKESDESVWDQQPRDFL